MIYQKNYVRPIGKVRNRIFEGDTLAKITAMADIPLLLSYYEAKLSLLLTISQTRAGAVHIVHAGLFQAVRASGLFSVDPDLGIGMVPTFHLTIESGTNETQRSTILKL